MNLTSKDIVWNYKPAAGFGDLTVILKREDLPKEFIIELKFPRPSSTEIFLSEKGEQRDNLSARVLNNIDKVIGQYITYKKYNPVINTKQQVGGLIVLPVIAADKDIVDFKKEIDFKFYKRNPSGYPKGLNMNIVPFIRDKD